jgi:hypothetical protein
MSRLANIAKIPRGNRDDFASLLRRAVVFSWLHSTHSIWPNPKLDDVIKELTRLQRTASECREALLALGPRALQIFDVVGRVDLAPAAANPLAMDVCYQTLGRVSEVAAKARSLAKEMKPGRGRPRALPSYDGRGLIGFDAFVWWLLTTVDDLDGRLTLDVHGERGSLIDFLKAVSPHLEHGLVPAALPLSRLSQLKRHLSKIARGIT